MERLKLKYPDVGINHRKVSYNRQNESEIYGESKHHNKSKVSNEFYSF